MPDTLTLPTTAEDWQTFFDAQFPAQLNVRIDHDDPDDDVDFSTPCLNVIGMGGLLPELVFWASDIDKDFRFTATVVVVRQTDPRLLLEIHGEGYPYPFLFWPRPGSGEDLDNAKAFNRTQAQKMIQA